MYTYGEVSVTAREAECDSDSEELYEY